MSEHHRDTPPGHRKLFAGTGRWWRGFETTHGRSTAVLWLVLVFATLGLGVFLVEGTKPWDAKIAARVAQGKLFRTQEYVAVYTWWAAAANMGILLGLVATVRWWGGRTDASCGYGGPRTGALTVNGRTWFWIAVLTAVVAAGIFRVPRLSHSFWNDEEYSMRRYSWGQYEIDPDGRLRFERAPLRDAIFKNTNGNNHVWHTAESRLAHAIRGLFLDGDDDRSPPRFSEVAARVFPFASGLATVVLVGVLGLTAGSARSGAVAAWLVALNPWHVRYAVEARGYGTLLLALLVMLVCGIRALETGRWRWWFSSAAGQAIALLCHLGSIYVVVMFNVVVGLGLLIGSKRPSRPSAPVGRWFVSSAVTACVVIQALLPSIPQILTYLNRDDHQRGIEMGLSWLRQLWAFLIIGFPWSPEHAAADVTHHGTNLVELTAANPFTWWFVTVIVPLAAATGTVVMIGSGWRARLVCLTFWGGASAAYLHNELADSKMYLWYLVYAILGLALTTGWGIDACSSRWLRRSAAAAVPLVLFVALFAWVTHPALTRMRQYDRQPIRQVVAHTRGESPAVSGAGDGVLTATFGVSDRQVFSYDPRAIIVREPGQLEQLIHQAGAEKKALFVFFCGRRETAARYPGTFEAVTGGGRFEKVAELPGLEAFFSYEIWRLKPGTEHPSPPPTSIPDAPGDPPR